MTLDEVYQRVADIKAASDDEVAHAAEDDLYVDVLRAIAEGARGSKLLAQAALAARELGHARWYA